MQTPENPQASKFNSRTSPPAGKHGPAYWFVFQGDKLLVRPPAEIPRAADLAALGLPAARSHYLGCLEDARPWIATAPRSAPRRRCPPG